MNNFIAHSEEERQEMLNNISCSSVDDLFKHIPVMLEEFKMDNPLSEMETTKDINRIKVVLVEKKRTNKWLAEQLGKDPATVSKWCTNTAQPSLETLLEIARVLDVDIKDLLHSTREDVQYIKIQQP